MAQDRHDLRKLLRDCDYWGTGWTNADGTRSSTDETGIFNRWVAGDLVEKSNDKKWRYTLQLGLWLRESES